MTAEDKSATDDINNAATDGSHDAVVIKPHEKRAINFLVNEYLLLHDYKLTSVTFAEENENQVRKTGTYSRVSHNVPFCYLQYNKVIVIEEIELVCRGYSMVCKFQCDLSSSIVGLL